MIDSEQRYRDLFEEAPIAYVLEGLDSRFIKANTAAISLLGLKPEEVAGTLGLSLVADEPENQRRIREAFASIRQGVSAGGFVVELRRKDNGDPVWAQWWSKPEPGSQYTRTMIVDITDRVRMEREQARANELARAKAQAERAQAEADRATAEASYSRQLTRIIAATASVFALVAIAAAALGLICITPTAPAALFRFGLSRDS